MADDFWSAVGRLFGGGEKNTPTKAPARQMNAAPSRNVSPAPEQRTSLPAFSGGGGSGGRYALSRTADRSSERGGSGGSFDDPPQEERGFRWDNTKPILQNIGTNLGELGKQFAESPGQTAPTTTFAGPAVAAQQVSENLRADVPGQIKKADNSNKRDDYVAGFLGRPLEVKQLSDDEWSALSPEQQKGVIANFALYQAAQQDAKLGANENGDDSYTKTVNDMFGEGGGSDKYAPNTVRVLNELGYQNKTGDLDLFLDGRGIATEDEVNRVKADSKEAGVAGILQQLENSKTLNNDNLTSALANGAKMLDAIGDTGTLSKDTLTLLGRGSAASQIPQDRLAEIDNVMQGMMNKSVWDRIQTDSSLGQSLQADLSAAIDGIDPGLVSQYFRERYRNYNGDPNFMNLDEFETNWLKPRS